MFDMHDHNRKGTQKEVGQCCNCLHNEHDMLRIRSPHLVCQHPIIQGQNNNKPKLIAMVYYANLTYPNGDPVHTTQYKEQLTGFPSWCPLDKED